MDILSIRLKWLREKHKCNQKEVAEKIGVTTSGYQKMEYGESKPKIETLIKISKLYRESVDFIIGTSDSVSSMKILDHDIYYLRKRIDEMQSEFLNKYFDEGISKEEKRELERSISQLKANLNALNREYVMVFLEVPCVNRERNYVLSDKMPIKIDIAHNQILNICEIYIADKNGNNFIHLDDAPTESDALSIGFHYASKYNLQLMGYDNLER